MNFRVDVMIVGDSNVTCQVEEGIVNATIKDYASGDLWIM